MRRTLWSSVAVIAVGFAIATLTGGGGAASVASHAPEPQYQQALELRGAAAARATHPAGHLRVTPPATVRGFDWSAGAVGAGLTVTTLAMLAGLGIAARTLRTRSGDGRTGYVNETA